MFENFYDRNGWDVPTSKPLPSRLKELGLDYVIDDIWTEEEKKTAGTVPPETPYHPEKWGLKAD